VQVFPASPDELPVKKDRQYGLKLGWLRFYAFGPSNGCRARFLLEEATATALGILFLTLTKPFPRPSPAPLIRELSFQVSQNATTRLAIKPSRCISPGRGAVGRICGISGIAQAHPILF